MLLKEKKLREYIKLVLEADEYPTQATLDKQREREKQQARKGIMQINDFSDSTMPVGEYKIPVEKIKKQSPVVKALKALAFTLGLGAVAFPAYKIAFQIDNTNKATSQEDAVNHAKNILKQSEGLNVTHEQEQSALDNLNAQNNDSETQTNNTQNPVVNYEYDHSGINRTYVIETLKVHEGFRASPYYDTKGFVTVGYGTKIEGLSQNTSKANQTLTGDDASAALKQLGEEQSSYTYTEGDTTISNDTASVLLTEKFDSIHPNFVNRIGNNYEYLPKELKELLADMAYNMGAYFFNGSNFIENVRTLSNLLEIAVNRPSALTPQQKEEIRDLVSFGIPSNMIDSEYFDDLTSPNDENGAGRPTPQNAQEVLQVINSYTGRPINLLNHYLSAINTTNVIFESKLNLKSIYKNLYS